eukprot:1732868-Prymnesium_polylepis.1
MANDFSFLHEHCASAVSVFSTPLAATVIQRYGHLVKLLAWFGALELSRYSVTPYWRDILAAGDWGQATMAALAARLVPGRDPTVSYLWTASMPDGPSSTSSSLMSPMVPVTTKTLAFACETYAVDTTYYMEVLRERGLTAFELNTFGLNTFGLNTREYVRS